jgi:hypothetical protein
MNAPLSHDFARFHDGEAEALRLGPTASLSLALDHRWNPESIFVIVTMYIDESGTHGSSVVILAGWVGRLGQWAVFDPKWRTFLKKNGLTYFHSKEMRDTDNEFKGGTIGRKREFMDKAARLALKSMAFGFTSCVKLDEYKKIYIGNERLRGVPIDSPYGLCFRHCVGMVASFAFDRFKDKELDIHFVLESGHKNLGDAERIFQEVQEAKRQTEEIKKIQAALRTISRAQKGITLDYR